MASHRARDRSGGARAIQHSSSATPLHILIVSNLYPPDVVGGAEVVAHRHARLLRERGHVVTVFAGRKSSPAIPDGSLDIDWIDEIKVYRTPLSAVSPSDNFHVPIVSARLLSILMIEKPNIVHFHNVTGLGSSLIALATSLGYRTVVTLHDRWGFCYRNTSLRNDGSECSAPHECGSACMPTIKPRHLQMTLPMRLRRDYVAWCLESADLLIAPSESLRAAYRESLVGSKNRFVVQSNGIDLAAIRARKSKPARLVRFTCTAYLGEHKGIPDLLEAATILASDRALAGRWSLTLIGDGHLRESVQSAISRAPLAGVVHHLGQIRRDQVLAVLQETDVVVLPSRWPENESVSLLEAIASGCAQIATEVGGTSALVEGGKSGELVPKSDPPHLAEAMASYIREPGKAARHGAYNRRRRANFSEDNAVRNIEEWYRQILSKPRQKLQSTIVICGSDQPAPLVVDVCNLLHEIEHPQQRVYLLWHGWVTDQARRQAKLYWNWGPNADAMITRQMLHSGIPLLAPRNARYILGLSQIFGVAVTYETYLEAAIILSVLPFDAPTLEYLGENAKASANFLAQRASSKSFQLPLPAL